MSKWWLKCPEPPPMCVECGCYAKQETMKAVKNNFWVIRLYCRRCAPPYDEEWFGSDGTAHYMKTERFEVDKEGNRVAS